MATTTRFSETIDALRQVEDLLQLLLDDATELLAEPTDEENHRWLVVIVDKMLANLLEQFRIEEHGGYMSNVLEQYPAWHPQILHLQQEHRLLEQQLQEIANRIQSERRDWSLSQECRRQLADWINWYRQHRRREIALVQEAFVLEVGQGE
jgi:glutamine synthetase adenylyltransferase